MIIDKGIDGGKAFDWGKTSSDYAKYRDIYPQEFYRRILDEGLCRDGQKVLDIEQDRSSAALPVFHGAEFTGTDISENQIETAKRLKAEADIDIRFMSTGAEDMDFPENSFDVITACQCYFYFNHEMLAPMLSCILKPSWPLW